MALLTAAFADFGPPPPVAAEQIKTLRMLADVLDDPGLAEIAERLDVSSAAEAVTR